MPRNTRAAARAGVPVLEDPSAAASIISEEQATSPASSSPGKTPSTSSASPVRTPLVEVGGNADDGGVEEGKTTPKKNRKKRKGKKKARKDDEVKEDENTVPVSPASEGAAELLREEEAGKDDMVVLDEEVAKPSPAADKEEMMEGGLVIEVTPEGDHAPQLGQGEVVAGEKLSHPEKVIDANESGTQDALATEGLPVESLDDTKVSTKDGNEAKVEAEGQADAQTAQKKPAAPNQNTSSEQKPARTSRKASPPTSAVAKKPTPKAKASKPNGSRPSNVTKTPATPRRSSVQPNVKTSIELKDQEKSTDNGIVAKVKERSAIAALNTPPQRTKSTKPVTKSNFQLPGDAITAKLKAQREERQKRQEEEAAKKREFKARPATKPKPVEVKGTTASRARMSLNVGETPDVTSKEPTKDATSKPSVRASTGGSGTISKAPRTSIVAAKSKPATTTTAKNPITAVKRAPSTTTVRNTLAASVSGRPTQPPINVTRTRTSAVVPNTKTRTSITTSEAAAQRQKGKEVFNRDRIEQEDREKTIREKAEAAKKARAEAAERGRIASREWAEKRKAAAKGPAQKASTVEKPQSTPVEAEIVSTVQEVQQETPVQEAPMATA